MIQKEEIEKIKIEQLTSHHDGLYDLNFDIKTELPIPYYDGVYDFNLKNKMELLDAINDEFSKIMNMSNEAYNSGNSNNGGKIRGLNGPIVENIVKLIIKTLCDIHKIESYQIYTGKIKPIRVDSKNGYAFFSVDIHSNILVNNKKINLYIEAKLNLDKTYITRADYDMSYIKKENNQNNTIIFAIQKALRTSTQNFYQDNGNIDAIFYGMDTTRNSQKAIWREEYYQKLNNNKLLNFINYIEDILLKA
jgi:hypothetical protein